MTLTDRVDYGKGALDEAGVEADPLRQFRRWFDEAVVAKQPEPNAMTLATARRDGRPSARIVLLKEVDARGFVFFGDGRSQKGRELVENPFGSLVFFWQALERQVRVSGPVEPISPVESDAYYQSRPKGSQLGAWASYQSRVIASRTELEAALTLAAARFGDAPIPRPDYWGGYRVVPERIEFWQGRSSRLHDRLVYSREGTAAWKIERLSP